MRGATVRVAAAQLPDWGDDLEANTARSAAAVRAAARAGATLVVLPELTTLPYFCAEEPAPYRGWAEPADGPLVRRFAALAAETGVAVVLGLFELDGERGTRHNALVVLGPDGTVAPAVDRAGVAHPTARKLHLPPDHSSVRGFDERAHFEAGDALGVHRAAGLRLGCLVCYDRRFPECWRELRALGADVVAVAVADSGGDRADFMVAELRAHARENGLVAVCANKIGGEPTGGHRSESVGSSCIVGADGDVLAHRPGEDGAGLVVADIDLDALADVRARWPYFEHRRTDLFGGPAPLARPDLSAMAACGP